MITQEELDDLANGPGKVLSSDGSTLGSMGEFYVDDQTGEPTWVTVATGLFGTSESFVPLQEATVDGADVRVPYSKEQVKDSPRLERDGHLNPDEEQQLFQYYGLAGDDTALSAGTVASIDKKTRKSTKGGRRGAADASRSAGGQAVEDRTVGDQAVGDQAVEDRTMTRSEEQLRIGTETRQSDRIRIHKHIVTENVTRTIPVRREEIRIERVAVADTDAGSDADTGVDGGEMLGGSAFDEEVYEIVLHEERPVIQLETVAVERIILNKETITSEEIVSQDVRKEVIETEGVDDATGRAVDQATDR